MPTVNKDYIIGANPISPKSSNKRYKLVRFAYDDEGTNMTALVDIQKKEIISYSVTGQAELQKFNQLTKNEITEKVKGFYAYPMDNFKKMANGKLELRKNDFKKGAYSVHYVYGMGSESTLGYSSSKKSALEFMEKVKAEYNLDENKKPVKLNNQLEQKLKLKIKKIVENFLRERERD